MTVLGSGGDAGGRHVPWQLVVHWSLVVVVVLLVYSWVPLVRFWWCGFAVGGAFWWRCGW